MYNLILLNPFVLDNMTDLCCINWNKVVLLVPSILCIWLN